MEDHVKPAWDALQSEIAKVIERDKYLVMLNTVADRLEKLDKVAAAARVITTAGPGHTKGPMWHRLSEALAELDSK